MRDAYFDTRDGRLRHQGVTLRHRGAQGQPGATSAGIWLLQLPAGVNGISPPGGEGDGEGDVLHWMGGREEIPAGALAVLRGVVRRARLEEIAEVPTVGHLSLLAHPPGEEGKAVGRRSSAGAVVAATIAADLQRLVIHDLALRVDLDHPPSEAVHQARVATRRLRADLKTFEPLLDPIWVRHTRSELRQVGLLLGSIRDVDVLRGRLGLPPAPGSGRRAMAVARASAEDGAAELAARLDAERDEASKAFADLAGSERYLNLLDRLHAAAARPPLLRGPARRGENPDRPAADALPRVVGPHLRTLRRRVGKAGGDPSDDRLHRIRIAAKQLRYASEMAGPVIGKPARRTARRAKELQGLLGDHHDAVVAEAWLRRSAMGPQATVPAAFLAGKLTAEQEAVQRALRREWRGKARRLATKKRHGWIP